jgi:hypothetical protein
MKFKKTPKKQNWLHRINPFNAMLKNRLANTLGQAVGSQMDFTSPVLNQGETEDCAIYCPAATAAAITGKIYDIQSILNSVLSYMNIQPSSYTGTDLGTSMYAGVNPGYKATDGSVFTYDTIIWILPENGQGLAETMNQYILQYQRPANVSGVWYQEMFNTNNGVVPAGGTTLLGGHDMMFCGKTPDAYLDNQGSWGVDAEGSVEGHYKFSDEVFDSYYTGYKVGIGINTNDPVVKVLGQLSAALTKLADLF